VFGVLLLIFVRPLPYSSLQLEDSTIHSFPPPNFFGMTLTGTQCKKFVPLSSYIFVPSLFRLLTPHIRETKLYKYGTTIPFFVFSPYSSFKILKVY
jgi:hypothetical protein